MPNSEAISVSALNRYVKILLENDEVLSQVWIEGELSDVHVHIQSGHIYFKVIDQRASVKAVMFRSYAEKLRFRPKDGMKVLISCKVSLYEKTGEFQIYAFDIIEAGIGKRQSDYELVKEILTKEGIFDQQRKRRLPSNPSRISVITSATGAVIKDIENVITRRNPFVQLLLYPVYVQGIFAVDAIISAIKEIEEDDKQSDLVIIARGGGSTDDLWIFNDEKLVRAASKLHLPFISAVGHETDYTLLDFAADYRVPTPSAAAEIAVPNINETVSKIDESISQIGSFLINRIHDDLSVLNGLEADTNDCIFRSIKQRQDYLLTLETSLSALSPFHILSKGFAYVSKEGKTIKSVSQINQGDRIDLILSDGAAKCSVEEVLNK